MRSSLPVTRHPPMIEQTRTLTAADTAALDTLLAGYGLAGAYARSHLQAAGESGVRAWGWPLAGALGAALVMYNGIAWTVWRDPAAAPALAARLATLAAHLLSGPTDLTRPVLAALPPTQIGTHDPCPFAVLTPATFRPAPGPARPATPADMEALIDFYSFGFYSLAVLPTRAAWRARLDEQLARRSMLVVVRDGRVVAAAQSSAETPAGAMIGGVATLPAYRNQGWSGVCVSGLCAHLFAAGRTHIGLFYLPGNVPAAHVYTRLGFQPSGEWWLIRLNGGWGIEG